jgi:hypothetical protein
MFDYKRPHFINDKYIHVFSKYPTAHVGKTWIFVAYTDHKNRLVHKDKVSMSPIRHEFYCALHKAINAPSQSEILEVKSKLFTHIYHLRTKHIYDKLLKNLKKAQYR